MFIMLSSPEIIIPPAKGCRRSKKILDYLSSHNTPFTRIDLETPPGGQALAERHALRASSGILVDGELINPFGRRNDVQPVWLQGLIMAPLQKGLFTTETRRTQRK